NNSGFFHVIICFVPCSGYSSCYPPRMPCGLMGLYVHHWVINHINKPPDQFSVLWCLIFVTHHTHIIELPVQARVYTLTKRYVNTHPTVEVHTGVPRVLYPIHR